MKYIKLFEKFTKDYMKKIDLKDFKKIKKGSKILYMGGQVEVLDNNGYVLKLKGEDGRTFTINKSQFDHGGMIKEVSDGKKKKKKKEFHPDMMYEAKGKKVINDLYKMDAQIDYLSDADDATKKIWKKAGVNPNDDNQIILYSYVNSWPETKKLLDKSRIKYKELEDPNSAGESFIVFDVNESINELRTSPVSGTMAGFTTSLEDRKYELKKDAKGATIGNFSNVTLPKGTIIYNLPGGVFADHFSLKNKYASRSSQGPQYFDKPTFKGIMIKQTPAVLSYIEKNSKVLESFDTEIVNEAKDSVLIKQLTDTFDKFKLNRKYEIMMDSLFGGGSKIAVLRKRNTYGGGAMIDTHKKDGGSNYDGYIEILSSRSGRPIPGKSKFDNIDDAMKAATKFVDSIKESLNELSSAQDGTKDSDGKHRHEHHLEEDIEAMWKKAYGENFSSQYPAVAKIIKQRKIKDKREIARIWQDTYGEDFEKEYPALFQKLS